MTTLSIQPPFPIIPDADGQPLEDGYIWIGTANLPPIGNPIAVYWDAALTIPAALPIRTRGGYPVNAGTPARLYVGSDYSILVQNKNGSTLYSAPDGASDRFSAAQISFLQAGAGAVVRTVQSKLRETVSVRDFGAVGDGVTDDTAAIQTAIDSNASYIIFPAGVYIISATLTLSVDCKFVGQSASIKWLTGVGFNMLEGNGLDFECVGLTFVGGTQSQADNTLTSRAIQITGPASRLVVKDCAFDYFDVTGVYVQSSELLSTVIENILIADNVFRGNATQLQAITCFGGENVVIRGNEIDGCDSVAILCDDATSSTPLASYGRLRKFVIADNVIAMPDASNPIVNYGIQTSAVEALTITGNVISNNSAGGGWGIVASIYDLGQQAAAPGGGAAYLPLSEDNSRVVIANNSVYNVSIGIRVEGYKAPTVSGNDVTATAYGIYIDDESGTVNGTSYTFPSDGISQATVVGNTVVSKDVACIGGLSALERTYWKDNNWVGTFAKRYETSGVANIATQVIEDADQQLNGATTLRFKQLMSGRLNYSATQTSKTVSLVSGSSNVIDRFVGNTSLTDLNYFVVTQADWDTTVKIVKTGKTSFDVVAGTACPTNNLGIYWAIFITEA